MGEIGVSYANKLRAPIGERPEAQKESMHILRTNIEKAKAFCQENRQDWVTLVVGAEGSGKSTLASHLAKMFDRNFKIDDSMIYNLKGPDHSLINFLKRWGDTPYKVTWYDEAVTVMFSHRANSKEVTDAQEIFKIKRECRHYDILVTPAFWDLVPDIRERRAKSLIYCYTEVYHPCENRTKYRHKYAYFSGEKIIKLSLNKKIKFVFRSPQEMFKLVKPDFIEEFPAMDKDIEAEYMASKRDNRLSVLDRIEGATPADKAEQLIKPGFFDHGRARELILEMNGGHDPNATGV